MAGRGKSQSRNAGIQFPVGRIVCFLKAGKYANWLGVATVYLVAVLEYLTVKVLELAENVARDNKTQIVSCHVQLAMCNDEELVKLLGSVTVTSDDILPNIRNLLLPKESFAKSATPVVDDI